MRPDLRSFSFTWLKGNQQENATTNGRSTASAVNMASNNSMKNLRSGILKSSNQAVKGGGGGGGGGKLKKRKVVDKKELYGCNPSKLKQLKEFSSSIFGHSSKTSSSKSDYSTIHEERMTDDELDGNNYLAAAPFDGFGQQTDENVGPGPSAVPAVQESSEDSIDKKSLRSTCSKPGICKKLNKTVQDVKSTFGNLSQKLRRSTRRNYRMTTPLASAESTPTRRVLGRTPTRLYSPFGFVDSPGSRTTPLRKTPKRLQRASTPRLPRKQAGSVHVHTELFKPYSPNGTLQRDIQDIGKGFEEMQVISQNVSRRNLRN